MNNLITITASTWSTSIVEPIIKSFTDMYNGIADALPSVIASIAILIIGYIIAVIIRKVLITTLTKIGFDNVLEKIGIAGVLNKIGIKASPTVVIAKLIFFVIMLFMVKNAASQLGVKDIELLMNSVFSFLPRVVIASVILLFGFIIAEAIQNVVRNGLEAMSLDYARPLSNIIFGFVFVIVLTVALDQLKIQTELLNDSVKIILASLGICAAIALGFGLKGLAKGIVSGVYVRDIYKPGTEVDIDGELAKVSGVGPVTTKLMKKDGGFIIIPNSELIEKKITGQTSE